MSLADLSCAHEHLSHAVSDLYVWRTGDGRDGSLVTPMQRNRVGHAALESVDACLRELVTARAQLFTEIRVEQEAAIAHVEELLAERRARVAAEASS
jgi:hypothetical protein